ncbi:DUF2510 domain-containing protein [Arthrobacter sp. NA-172]|uniref:DUF2510 domain-containing protein n=1 Tax=Arthrobacter sp. NA-172 TaxID=3367524 RepID=UPI0037542A93
MSVPPGRATPGPAPAPGWYPDPSGSGQLRWWDGRAWTGGLGGPQHPVQRAARPHISQQTPVYNAFIWLIVGLPALPLIMLLFWNPGLRLRTIGAGRVQTADMSSIFTLPYILIVTSSLLIYAVSVFMAYLDWQRLNRDGVVRPFHWAWVFLSREVYVIGRSIIVNQVAPRRGLAPIWATIGVAVLAVVIVSIKVSVMFSTIATQLPTM